MADENKAPGQIDYKSINLIRKKTPKPLTNYTLSTVCPSCGHDTYKLACKVRCPKCHFMWDCSEL